MVILGCHLSAAKGFQVMGQNALAIQADTFQFFTRNPRGSKAKAINREDIGNFLELAGKHGLAQIIAHAPYTINACSADDRIRDFAREIMSDDLARMEYLPHNMYNIHPGSHVGQGPKKGIERIISLLNSLLWAEQKTVVLLETMTGKGTEIGGTFEELAQILDGVVLSEKIGVCLDTCHVYDGGYDIVSDLDGVLDRFDRTIGLEKLRAIHINDSANPFASRKDRHARIGEGAIGLESLVKVVTHPRLSHLPFILETPNDLPGYADEIKLLRTSAEVLQKATASSDHSSGRRPA